MIKPVVLLFAFILSVACQPFVAPVPPPTDVELLARHVDCPVNTPMQLAPPDGTTVLFALDAWGVQDYECTGGTWRLREPRADLYMLPPHAHMVMRHFGGPTWQFTIDSSLVVGTKTQEATPDVTAIPWLLLQVSRHVGDPGSLTPVTWIQRLSTRGGLAPAAALCTATGPIPDANGKFPVSIVPYVARYVFSGNALPGITPQRCGA